jgi:hypothetical protein
MKDLTIQYENAKKRAMEFMKLGDISAYLQTLSEMNRYKRMIMVISYN